jgi:hypothetical protein
MLRLVVPMFFARALVHRVRKVFRVFKGYRGLKAIRGILVVKGYRGRRVFQVNQFQITWSIYRSEHLSFQ